MSIQWIFLLVLQAQCLCAFTFPFFIFFFSVSLFSFKKRVNCIVDSTVSSLSNHLNPNYFFFPCAFFLIFIVFYFCKWSSVHAHNNGKGVSRSFWKCEVIFFFFSPLSSFQVIWFEKRKKTAVNTFVCANRYLQACVGACVYVCAHVCWYKGGSVCATLI